MASEGTWHVWQVKYDEEQLGEEDLEAFEVVEALSFFAQVRRSLGRRKRIESGSARRLDDAAAISQKSAKYLAVMRVAPA